MAWLPHSEQVFAVQVVHCVVGVPVVVELLKYTIKNELPRGMRLSLAKLFHFHSLAPLTLKLLIKTQYRQPLHIVKLDFKPDLHRIHIGRS